MLTRKMEQFPIVSHKKIFCFIIFADLTSTFNALNRPPLITQQKAHPHPPTRTHITSTSAHVLLTQRTTSTARYSRSNKRIFIPYSSQAYLGKNESPLWKIYSQQHFNSQQTGSLPPRTHATRVTCMRTLRSTRTRREKKIPIHLFVTQIPHRF